MHFARLIIIHKNIIFNALGFNFQIESNSNKKFDQWKINTANSQCIFLIYIVQYLYHQLCYMLPLALEK